MFLIAKGAARLQAGAIFKRAISFLGRFSNDISDYPRRSHWASDYGRHPQTNKSHFRTAFLMMFLIAKGAAKPQAGAYLQMSSLISELFF